MILGPVSYIDCIVFCIFLAPQLIRHVGLIETIKCVLEALPFFCTFPLPTTFLHFFRVLTNERGEVFQLPTSFIYQHYLLPSWKKPPFVRKASPFEDFVIRCVRYAFANIPPNIGRVFFSKEVALPFLKWRLFRHGYLKSPVLWREHVTKEFRGLWVMKDPMTAPDFVLYYAHGELSIFWFMKEKMADF